jgi:hypothetical protein
MGNDDSSYIVLERSLATVMDLSGPLPPCCLILFISVYILAYGQSLTLYDTEQHVHDSQ